MFLLFFPRCGFGHSVFSTHVRLPVHAYVASPSTQLPAGGFVCAIVVVVVGDARPLLLSPCNTAASWRLHLSPLLIGVNHMRMGPQSR